MENQSPFLDMQRVEAHVKALLRSINTDLLSTDEKKAAASLRRLSIDSRLDVRDYELSETREEQLKKAEDARKCVTRLKASLLAVGNMFSPADIAQIDAQLEHIKSRLL